MYLSYHPHIDFFSSFFSWFSKFVRCCRFSLANRFVKLIIKFWTSYFKSSHFSWLLKRDSFVVQKLPISFLISVIYFWSLLKEPLNFQNPVPLAQFLPLERVKSTGDWSGEIGVSTSVVVTNSWGYLKQKCNQVYVEWNLRKVSA